MFHKNFYWFSSLNNDLTNNYQSKDVVTSTDEYGEIWRLTSTSNVSSVIFKDICYGNGVFVAVGTNGAIYRSSDGDSFSQVGSVSGNFTGVCYGGHFGTPTFIAVGDGGIYRSTDNGTTWTAVDTSVIGLKSVSYTGSAGWTFVAVGNTNVRKSTDGGITWTSMGYYASFNDICYGGKFVAVGYDNNGGKIYYSTNAGITMTLATGYGGGPVYGVCYGNGKYVCVGSGIYYSTDGITWTGVDGDGFAAGKMYGICYGDGTFVVVGADGAIYYSTDGITWNAGSNDRTQLTLNSVCYGNGRFIAVGGDESTSSGYFLYSVYKEYTENLVDMVNALEAAIGSTDISAIGADVKAAISSLNTALANTQTALDNKVTTGTSAKLNTLALAGSKIALVYSEDDNVNFRYKNASGNTSYLNLRSIVSTFDTLTSRGGYTYLAGLYNSTDEATTYKACSTISNYRYLVLVLKYADLRVNVKTIPRAFFVNEITKQAYGLLLKSGNSEAAAIVWWDSASSSIFAFINKSYNVVDVYGIL